MADDMASAIADLSVWLDESAGSRDLTAHLLYRVGKVSAEAGEVQDALEGYLGWNPRKGKTHEFDDVRKELLDVVVAGLCAYEHTTGNDRTCMDALADHIRGLTVRAGLTNPALCICCMHNDLDSCPWEPRTNCPDIKKGMPHEA